MNFVVAMAPRRLVSDVRQWVPALVGSELGGYQIGPFLNSGGFGMVFEVRNLVTNAPFAMKILPPTNDARAATEFDVEGELLRKLVRRSHVINWVESSSADVLVPLNGTQVPLPFKYHVMALASGSLDELIADPAIRADLSWGDRLHHLRGAVRGVHQMHLSNIAHRDIKTSNCFLMVYGGKSEVRIGDLGRSKDFSLPSTLPADIYLAGRGDLSHAPPEYLWFQGGQSEFDYRCADLYGIGSLFVELATGHPITALAIGSWHDALQKGAQDRSLGVRRDLAVLRPSYYRAIEHMAEDMPPQIRQQAVGLIRQLCDPVPSERQPKRSGKPPKVPDDGLAWLLRRIDILIGTLTTNRASSRIPHGSLDRRTS